MDLISILVILCFFFFVSTSYAAENITQGESIVDGQTLVFAGNIFELGFFSPGKSTSRYVGIWYHRNISAHQFVVWVANRDAPIRGPGGRLNFTSAGDLVLLDGASSIVWSTNSAGGNSTTMRLTDDGNLVLQQANGTVTWASFDHPTDTFLPGMRVCLNKTTGEPVLYRSWRSPDDPSPGNYSLGLDPGGSGQIMMWDDGGKPRWRSGLWNGHRFIGTVMRTLNNYGFKYNDGKFYTYKPHNASLLRFVLQWDGSETTWMNVRETKQWETVWEQPINECDIYGKCGVYGSCSFADGKATCGCLQGFEPRSWEEWSAGNWTRGCGRRTPLSCEVNGSSSSDDGFQKVVGVKLPDHSQWNSNIASEDGCRDACLSNCSCEAYIYSPSDFGCLMWEGDLIDIYHFSDTEEYDLNIKLAAADLVADDTPIASNKRNIWKIIVIVSTVGSASLLVACFLLWWKCNAAKGFRKKQRQEENVLASTNLSGEALSEFSGPSIYGEEKQEGKGSELPIFTFDFMEMATNFFSDSNKLGEGGFGYVYKGTLPGGEEVAVKRLSRSSGQGIVEFKNEVILISKLQHRNLVRLLGCCIQGEEKILVYEYLPNKSLDAILFDPLKKDLLDWKTRSSIIEGIARGLLYLHRDSRLRIVHRDLKASNVLLDQNMNPKISDFGMARIFGGDENQGNTTRVVGTFGYMSPEYAMEGLFSVRSDVYSFGILVLEIVTGRRNSSFHRMENAVTIVGHAWQMWNEDRAEELIDPSIKSPSMVGQVVRCIHIALLCVQDRASDRPDIDNVIRMMDCESGLLPMPRQPTFIAVGSPNVTETMPNKYESFSAYDVTITRLQGR
ncbi:hypothetical protein Cni_G16469 [Canna indica]|uniref:Receptor-like serine/threonine-protein kinase n=1 Tax=Canna indica TaxID=4628 RepID=A0AAQ3KFE0_9LILI|nr:hypothetical protein Cni_G16469 [Canna indica]